MVYFHAVKSSPFVPFHRHINTYHTLPYNFLMIHSNFLSSHLCLHLPSGPFPSSFPTKTANARVLAPTFSKCPDYLILIDLIIEQFKNAFLSVTDLFRWGIVWDLITFWHFKGEDMLVPRPIPKVERHSLSFVRDCMFSIFRATVHVYCVVGIATR